LRVLDPFRAEISVRFNNKGGSSRELVNAFFDSFLQRQDFFRGHPEGREIELTVKLAGSVLAVQFPHRACAITRTGDQPKTPAARRTFENVNSYVNRRVPAITRSRVSQSF
jgi:hypothetical protein